MCLFFLTLSIEPRVLSAPTQIILVYEGTSTSIGSFIARIEANTLLDISVLSALSPARQPLATSTNPILLAHAVAGFELKAEKTTTADDGTRYYSVLLEFGDYHTFLTFEQFGQDYIFLEAFPDNGFVKAYEGNLYSFEERWQVAQSDFVPGSIPEKALFALGCNFSAGEGILWEFEGPSRGMFRQEINYDNHKYLLYSCTLVTDYERYSEETIDEFLSQNLQFNNIVAIFVKNENNLLRLWSHFYNDTVFVNWGDINLDNTPDLAVNRIDRSFSNVGNTDLGTDVYQLTNSGQIIDLLFGIEKVSAFSRGGAGSRFQDFNGDGVAEFARWDTVPPIIVGSDRFTHITLHELYVLEDDYYYFPAKPGVYSFLCIEAMENLPDSPFSEEELLTLPPDVALYNYEQFAELPFAYPNRNDATGFGERIVYIKDIESVLQTCDTVGISLSDRNLFVQLVVQRFPRSCRGFLDYIHRSENPSKTGIQLETPNLELSYWDEVFSEFGNSCLR